MDSEYSIENLHKTFSDHMDQVEKSHIQGIFDFQKNHPDDQLPDHLKHPFNLPRALRTICEELINLKKS